MKNKEIYQIKCKNRTLKNLILQSVEIQHQGKSESEPDIWGVSGSEVSFYQIKGGISCHPRLPAQNVYRAAGSL